VKLSKKSMQRTSSPFSYKEEEGLAFHFEKSKVKASGWVGSLEGSPPKDVRPTPSKSQGNPRVWEPPWR
jgi:hypothetical protein